MHNEFLHANKIQCFSFQKPQRQIFYYIMKLIFIALLFCEAEIQSSMKRKSTKVAFSAALQPEFLC